MSNFKIGEKVVCVIPIYNLKKDRDYIIKSIYACKCGELLFDLNINKIAPNTIQVGTSRCVCGQSVASYDSFSARRFRKLDYEFADNILAEISEAMKQEAILN